MFEWKSQTCRGENDYRLQIVTDDPVKYKAVEAFVQVLIDSKPEIHARWIYNDGLDIECSACHAAALVNPYTGIQERSNRCPSCGAEMDA